jgi:hypothetical protein
MVESHALAYVFPQCHDAVSFCMCFTSLQQCGSTLLYWTLPVVYCILVVISMVTIMPRRASFHNPILLFERLPSWDANT